MTILLRNLTLVAVAIVTAACTSTPTTNLLTQAREDYRALEQSPMAATYAPLETKQAGDALAQANLAAEHRDGQEKIDHLAYIAQQKISLTRESIKQKSAEAEIAQAGIRRDQMRLDQRTAEADLSKLKEQIAHNEAIDAKDKTQRALSDAAAAKLSTQIAYKQAIEAKRDAKEAQADMAQAKRGIQVALHDAEEAKAKTDAAHIQVVEANKKAQAAAADASGAKRLAQDAQAQSAQLQAQLTELSAKKTDHGMVITLGDLLFGTDIARLNASGARNVQKLGALLQENQQRTVLVEGFTDSTGSAEYNQGLSERRAKAVRLVLVDMGIAQERVAIRGYGEEMPVAPNDTAANRQLNRRVEIVLSDENGTITAR